MLQKETDLSYFYNGVGAALIINASHNVDVGILLKLYKLWSSSLWIFLPSATLLLP